jgi:hypothetical protein
MTKQNVKINNLIATALIRYMQLESLVCFFVFTDTFLLFFTFQLLGFIVFLVLVY